jgi:hypothetical protein
MCCRPLCQISSRPQVCMDKRHLVLLGVALSHWRLSGAWDILAAIQLEEAPLVIASVILTGGARPLSRGIGWGGFANAGAATGSAQNHPILKINKQHL